MHSHLKFVMNEESLHGHGRSSMTRHLSAAAVRKLLISCVGVCQQLLPRQKHQIAGLLPRTAQT